jgi:hypothetical protein
LDSLSVAGRAVLLFAAIVLRLRAMLWGRPDAKLQPLDGKGSKVRASGEGEAGILQMTPELAKIFASFQPSCKTDAKCGPLP